tara:strand:- start:10037 stop:10732 length:696 start_codon:yes stop_codon:yes gene_type:complete
MEKNKTGKYLKYAIGEIVLVVIGILIALSINNWNEERKVQNKLLNIYSLIYNDFENDKLELKINLDFYNQKKSVFDKVLHDSITFDLLDQGLSRLLGGTKTTILNRTGVNQLRELENKDSLTLKIIGVYDAMETQMLKLENRITNEIADHTEHLRDTYQWYPEWINDTIMTDVGSKELHDYFLTSSIYKNRVVSVYQQTYNNYVPMLKDMIEEITELQEELNSIVEKSNEN